MNSRIIISALLGVFALLGCEGKNVGQLITPNPPPKPPPPMCPGPAPECNPTPCMRGDPLPDLECGIGACARQVPACLDGVANVCTPGEPTDEICDNVDNDCDSQIDNGCDVDGDGFCDGSREIVANPFSCEKGGTDELDCDDQNPERNPGRVELCDDGFDNNCNDLTDYLDVGGCTHVTASFEDGDGLALIEHGTTRTIRASLTPPSLELSREWLVASATPDANCSIDDLTIEDFEEAADSTARRVTIIDDASRLDCDYRLELHIAGILADTLTVRMSNPRPRVDEMDGAFLVGGALVLTAPAGSTPVLRPTIPPDPDTPVTLRWGGANAGLLDCNAPCEGPEMSFSAPPPAGRYSFTVFSRDAFDGQERSRAVRVEVVPCVWARVGSTGNGRGPGVAQALPNLQTAANAAQNSNANVCIATGGQFTINQDLSLPTDVGLIGGFSANGTPNQAIPVLSFSNGKLSFGTNHSGQVRRVKLTSTQAADPLVEVINASPRFVGVEWEMTAAGRNTGLAVLANQQNDIEVTVASSQFSTLNQQQSTTAIDVMGMGPVADLQWLDDSNIAMTLCRGDCVGIRLRGSADATVAGRTIDVLGIAPGGRAYGVLVQDQASAEIRNMSRITARTGNTNPADVTVGVQLDHARGVTIRNNFQVGPVSQSNGTLFSAGIADGYLDANGLILGESTTLSITANRQINAGRANYAMGDSVCSGFTGPTIAAGIFLAGSSTVTIANNGNHNNRNNNISGGATSARQLMDPRLDYLDAPAVWTVRTQAVTLRGNEIRPGALIYDEMCTDTNQTSAVSAIRDGGVEGDLATSASRDLRLEANGIVSGRRATFDTVNGINRSANHLIVLRGTQGFYAANNYLAVTHGPARTAFSADAATNVALWNNVFEINADDDGLAENTHRHIVVQNAPNRSWTMANNILVGGHDGQDQSDTIAMHLPNGEAFLQSFDNNLLFLEGAESTPMRGNGVYVQTNQMSYRKSDFDAFTTIVGGQNNLILPPLFQTLTLEHQRSRSKLSADSPAIDAGKNRGAPVEDRFGTMRPIGNAVDIGHHEFPR